MEDYISTIKVVRNSLSNDQKWKTRYDRYMTNLTDEKLERFTKAQKQFSVPVPFHLYMRLSTAVNECSSIRTYFELRFHGQSVAEILVYNDLDKEVFTAIKAPSNIIKTLKAAGMNIEAEKILQYHCECYNESNIDQWLSWHSEQAKDFRKIYLDLENKIQSDSAVKKALGQPEHDMECELLKNYSQKSSAGKEILNIQPVMMGNTGARFQMPTAIKASTAKNGTANIEYSNSKHSGGGIDILARMGSGKGTKLAVLELKDSYSKSEPPEKVMHQAVAYATFIRELLRSDCGDKWWKFFGFGGDIPQKLEIKAIVVMPYNANAETDFGGAELPIDNDSIKLGYIYRLDIQGNQKICI